MKYGFFRRLGTFALAVALMIPFGAFNVRADSDGTITVPVDSVNGTRWADIIVVYKDRPTTLQNEWGWNVVVSADGVVIDKIPGGDVRGKNLAVPEGGFVLSGTGEAGDDDDNPHAWFCAAAPAEDPTYVVAAIVEHGGGGGYVASNVCRGVLGAVYGVEMTDPVSILMTREVSTEQVMD